MLPHLQTLCTTYLSGNLAPQNACGIYEFANFIEDEKLEEASLKIIKDKTKLALAPGSSFEDLALGTVIHTFSLYRLTIDSELDLLAAAERYVLACQKRVKEMADLNTASSEVFPDVSVANSINKDTNKVDTVKCNPNSNGDNESNTSSSDADQENVFVSKRMEKDSRNQVDTVQCNPDSNGSNGVIENHESNPIPNGAPVENQEPTTADTQFACSGVINKARSEGTFRFTVNNVSKMESDVSPSFYVRNLPWTIEVERVEKGQKKYLSFFVRCNGDSKSITWSCKALVDYSLISHKPDTKPYVESDSEYCWFSSNSESWGYPKFVTWNKVLDPKKGFVKDDSITLEVHVTAEPSQGLSWHSKNCISGIDIEDESVRALLWPIRFLTLTGKDLAEYEPKLKLLANDDMLAIMMNIISEKTKTPMPKSFTTSRTPRLCYNVAK